MLKNINSLIIKILFLIILTLWAIIIKNKDIISEKIGIFWENMLIFWVIFLEFLFFLFFINYLFEKNIKQLTLAVKEFLVWDKPEDFLYKTNNWDINFILWFLKNIIFSLKWIKDEFKHWKEIKSEVSLAKEIQEKMLQKKLISVPSLNILMSSKPAWEVWWDSYDIIKNENSENYYIYVWDATGHWVWAWFIMTMVNTLIEAFSKDYTKGSDILVKTNFVLKPRLKANLLMSLLLIRWDEENKRLFMSWAGHEYLIIYKQNLKKTFKVKSGGVALWMVKDISKITKEVEIKVDPGDIIVLYSDWVTEAINRPKRDWTEQLFSEDRLIDAIQSAPEIPGSWYKTSISVYKSITIALSQFMGYKHTQLDDITLWVIQYKPTDYSPEKDFSTKIEEEFITEWKW